MKILYAFLATISCLYLSAQQKGFVAPTDLFGHRVFIKNNGQFNKEIPNGNDIKYGYTNAKEKVYFTPTGLVYHLPKVYPITHEQFEEMEHGKVPTDLKPTENYYVNVNWEGANNNIQIEEEQKQSWYHSYGDKELKSDCFKKITYKNVYNNIDIEYLITDDKKHGIKYNIILHAGANPNDIKIKYSGDVSSIKLENGNVLIKTSTENITEHSPVSLQNNATVESEFTLKNNIISFNFPKGYDNSKDLIIDPWVTSLTTLAITNQGYDVDYDYFGNYFVFGGTGPYLIAKYNSLGVLQWTFNGVVPSQSWTSNNLSFAGSAGNFIVEKQTGKSFMGDAINIGAGLGVRIVRIGVNGLYDNFITNVNPSMDELWDFSYDCVTNRIFVISGGTSANSNIALIDQGSGNIITSNVTGIPYSGLSGCCQDVVSGTVDPSGNLFLYFVSIFGSPAIDNHIGRVNSSLNGNIWLTPSTYVNFSEGGCKNYTGSGLTGINIGFNALYANNNYLFYYDGENVAAYSKTTGAKLGSITTGLIVREQGGIAADNCNNVYIGGNGSIRSYNFNGSTFSTLASIPVSGKVYDIKYDENSNLLYVSGAGFGGVYNAINSTGCVPLTNLSVISGCSGVATATVTTSFSSPFVTYTWYNSSGSIVSQTNNTSSLTNTVSLSAGTYTVFSQVNAPCGPVNSEVVTITGSGGAPSVTNISPSILTCATTVVNPGVSTASSPVSFSWSGPGITSANNISSISVNAPGTYNYVVTNTSNGCSTNGSIIVSQNTTPPSASASSGGAITCLSPNVTLTGGGGGSYSWTGPGIVSGASSANPVVNAGGTYNLTVTDGSNGCSSGTSVVVSQNTTPPSPTASASGVITCSSPNVTLTGGGGGSYSWTGPGIVSGATTANPVVNAGGTYNLTVTGSNGCTAGTSVNVTASAALPTASAGSPQTLNCSTTSTSLNGSATGGNGVYSYAWSPATGLSATNIANPTANPSSSQTYVLLVTDGNGCQSSSNVVITVNTTPPSPTANAGSNLTCANTSLALTGGGGGTYSWTGPGIVSGATTANPTINQPGTYNLTVTDPSNGCSAGTSVSVLSDTATPTISVVPTSSNTILGCGTNATVMYSVAVTSASGNNSYIWQPSGSNSVFTTVSGAGIHSVTVTDNINGCSTGTTFNVLSNTTSPSITAADSTLFPCDSNATALIASSSNPNVSYAWQGASVLSGANSNVASIGSVGVYTVTVTDNVTNCFSTHTVAVTMDSVVALFSANPNIGVEPLIVTFFNSSVSSNTANTTYSWDFGNASPTSTLTNPSNTFELSGVYSVTLVATLGVCSDSAYATVIVNEDVTLIIPNFFTPNGDSQNELFFITGIEKYPNNQLEIYNRWGSLVYLKKAYNNTFDGKPNQPSMGSGMLPSGTYFYVLDLGDNTAKPYKGYLEIKY